MSKICLGCKVLKPLSDFRLRRRSKDGRTSRCKECLKAKGKCFYTSDKEHQVARKISFYQDHKEQILWQTKEKRYGITKPEYEELLVRQKGLCAICGNPPMLNNQFGTEKLVIDHDHSTNKVRGLLCSNCNRGIGALKENKRNLFAAILYLQEGGPKQGGVKFDQKKTRLDLVPTELDEAVGTILGFGAGKYGDHNWRGGLKYSRVIGALYRHLSSYRSGEKFDPETGCSHLWHAACNLSFLITYDEHPEVYQEFNDLFTYFKELSPTTKQNQDDTSTHLPKLDVIHDEGNEDEFEDELEREDLYEEKKSLPKQPPPYHKFLIGYKVRTKTLSLEGIIENYHETLKDCYYVKIPLLSPNTPVFHELELEAVNG